MTLAIPPGLRLTSVRPAVGQPDQDCSRPPARPCLVLLHYHLDANGFAAWDLVIQVPPGSPEGRHFVTAMIIDDAGQLLEDAAAISVGGEVTIAEGTISEISSVAEVAAEAEAEAAEAELTELTGDLEVAPGGHARDRGEADQSHGL